MALYPVGPEKQKLNLLGARLVPQVFKPLAIAVLAGACLGAAPKLQSTGIKMVQYVTPAKAHGVLSSATLTTTGGGTTVSLAGSSAASSRLAATSIKLVSCATPVKTDARLIGGTLTSKVALAGLGRASALSESAGLSFFYPTCPSRATARLPGAALTTAVTNFSLGNARSSASARAAQVGLLKNDQAAAPIRAAPLAQATGIKSLLPAAPVRVQARAQAGGVKLIVGATAARASSRLTATLGGRLACAGVGRVQALGSALLTPHFPTTSIGTGSSASNGRARTTGIKLVYNDTPSRATAVLKPAFLNAIIYCTPSRATGYVKSTTLTVGTIASMSGISRESTRLMASLPLNNVCYATPCRALGYSTGKIRFVGAGFDMGIGRVRENGRLRSTGIKLIYYATPSSGIERLRSTIQAFYSVDPSIGFGYARTFQTLGLQGQIQTAYSRVSGRLRGNLSTFYAVAPSTAQSRSGAVLGFTGGPKVFLAGRTIDGGKLQALQLKTITGPTVGVVGRVIAEGRLAAVPFENTYYATPSKSDVRTTASARLVYHTVPSIGTGRASATTLSSTNKILLFGAVRHSARAIAAPFNLRPQLTGDAVSSTRARAIALNLKLSLVNASCRATGVVVCTSQLQVIPPVPIQIAGRVRAAPRLTAQITAMYAVMPAMESARLTGAILGGKVLCVSVLRAEPRATATLGMTAPTVVGITGKVSAQSRVVSAIKTRNAAAPCLTAGRVLPVAPTFRTAIASVSCAQTKAWAVLAFTGATLQPVSGVIVSDARAQAAAPRTYFKPSPIRGDGRALATLGTKAMLIGQSLATTRLSGAFPNPYAQALSRAGGRAIGGTLSSTLPVIGGALRATGRTIATLTIPAQLPQYMFLAKCRHYRFAAADRPFVIQAKDRVYIFYA